MAITLAEIKIVSCVALTNVVASLIRLKLICEPGTKPLPFTVNVMLGPPAVAAVGEMFETTGCVLLGGRIDSVTVLEVPPPGMPFEGLVTEIVAVPWAAI